MPLLSRKLRALAPAAVLALALVVPGAAQGATDGVVVDVARVLSDTSRRPTGLNLNYLNDDDRFTPRARPLATAVREARAGYLRYPGGEKADSYLWSVAPFDRPRPTLARTGPSEWPSNDPRFVTGYTTPREPLDFDEFIATARLAGAKPTVVVAFDAMYKPASPGGTAPSRRQLLDTAVGWVRYARAKGYGVRYWELGNESYHPGSYNGVAPSARRYAEDVLLFARAMKAADPAIRIGANGGATTWWRTVLEAAAPAIDFLAVHDYACWGQTGWGYERYRTTQPDLTPRAREALRAIDLHAPAADQARIKVAVTETGCLDWLGGWAHVNDLGHALVTFDQLGQYLAEPRVLFAQLWGSRWTEHQDDPLPHAFDLFDRDNALNPTGRALAVWGTFLRTRMVSATGTDRVRAFASHSPGTGETSVFLLNKDTTARRSRVTLRGARGLAASAGRWVLGGTGPEATRVTWGAGSSVGVVRGALEVELPPVSVTVLTLRSNVG